MKVLPVLACAVLLLSALAGCSEPEKVVVVDSSSTVLPSGTQTAPPPMNSGKEGHIAGYVVDDAYRVLPGLTVRLPAFGLTDTTDRNGEFAFVDLPPGSYLLSVEEPGYQKVRTMVDVAKDKFTRLQVILRPIPPPEPYHETWPFEEIAHVTNTNPWVVGWSHGFYVNASEDLHTIVLEAVMEDPPGGSNGFTYWIGPSSGPSYTYGDQVNPLRVVFQVNGTEAVQPSYRVSLAPWSEPAPETDKRFEVFVTMFYHAPPPEGWSIQDAA